MRLTKKKSAHAEGDLTPMIDMTFQLIAFFMVLINFSEAEQDQRVRLPISELAKPPDSPPEQPLTVQFTGDGTFVFGTKDYNSLQELAAALSIEARLIASGGRSTPQDATIIVRADGDAPAGIVQEIFERCQQAGFERFHLRAKQEKQ